MVATSHPLATQIGVEVLRSGGTAVDAAIAANAALGLMEHVLHCRALTVGTAALSADHDP